MIPDGEARDAGVRIHPHEGAVRLPDLVIIGAAKAGTTALYWYLAGHPQVFMSPVKETNYFAFGLDEEGEPLYGDPELHHFPVRTLERYQQLFAGAGDALAVGEASPIYLECPQAADRIRETLPGARIICILREPVDRAYSDYLMYLRARGRRFEPARDLTVDSDWARPDSHWMQISRYHEALSRYFDAFPREQISVLLFDDLKRDQLRWVQSVYRILGVDPGFVPDFDTPHNVGGMPANMLVEKIFTSSAIKSALEPWIPERVANAVRRMRTRNMRKAPPLPAELGSELRGLFREDIEKTSSLIGRNLDHWLRPA